MSDPSRHQPAIWLLVVWIALSCAFLTPRRALGDENDPKSDRLAALIEQLGANDYRQRERAAQSILVYEESATQPLTVALQHADAQVRASAMRLLKDIHATAQAREVERLLHQYDPGHEYKLPGWQPFRQACGDDLPARSLYRRLLSHDAGFMRWFQRLQDDANYDIENQIDDQQRFLSPDAERLRAGDCLAWSKLLLAGTHHKICQMPVLGSHIRCGLQSAPTVTSLTHGPHGTATHRLVVHWLNEQASSYANGSIMRIAMLYDCPELVRQLALSTLDNAHAPPSATQTAMLFLTVQQPHIAAQPLQRLLEDHRVCQIWQIATVRRRAIQTQVRDTALALLLHLENIDPRSVGFQDLQADPMTIYDEQTLGFETQQQRETAHRAGLQLLNPSPSR